MFLYLSLSLSVFRMDLPPPFKPPPPPVKYTAARQSEISTQRFPTSRCNSLAFENRIISPDTLHIDRWYITCLNREDTTEARPCGDLLNLLCSAAVSLGTAVTKQLQAIVQMWAACTSDVGSLLLCINFVCVLLYFHQTYSNPWNVYVWF